MDNMRKILNRAGDHLSKRGFNLKPGVHDEDDYSNAHIARAFGISPTRCNNWKTRNAIPYEELWKFCAKYNCSMRWLMTGETLDPPTVETSRYKEKAHLREIYEDLRYFRERTRKLERENHALKKSFGSVRSGTRATGDSQ